MKNFAEDKKKRIEKNESSEISDKFSGSSLAKVESKEKMSPKDS